MKKRNRKETTELDILLENNKINDLDHFNKLVRKLMKQFIEKTLDAELDEQIGYEKWDQKSREVSNNYRKGTTPKKVKSSYGEIDINVPRDELNEFEPQLVKKHQRDISKIENQIIKLYGQGLSTRQINKTLREFYDIEFSKDTISRITDKILPEIYAWQQRPLDDIYPIVFIDGIRFKVKEDSMYTEKSVYLVIGINLEGYKEILGFWIAESESAKQWLAIMNELKTRGLKNILIACCDNLKGISEALEAVYPKIKIQKCIVHQIRNSLKHVRNLDKANFTKDMKKIYQAPSYAIAKQALAKFTDNWSKTYPYATKSWENNMHELSTFFEFPYELRKVIYTTNVIENVNRNIRQLTKSKGGFVSTNALAKLIYLRIVDINKDTNKRAVHNWGIVLNQLKIIFSEDEIEI